MGVSVRGLKARQGILSVAFACGIPLLIMLSFIPRWYAECYGRVAKVVVPIG